MQTWFSDCRYCESLKNMRHFVDRDAPSFHDKTSRKIREAAGCFSRGKTPRYFAVGIPLIINVLTHAQHFWRVSAGAVLLSHRLLFYESGRIQEPAAVWKSVNLIPYDLKIPTRLSMRQSSAIFISISLSRFQWPHDHTFSLYNKFLEIPSHVTFCPVIPYPTHWSLNVSFTLQFFVASAIGASTDIRLNNTKKKSRQSENCRQSIHLLLYSLLLSVIPRNSVLFYRPNTILPRDYFNEHISYSLYK